MNLTCDPDKYWHILQMPYGAERRKEILKFLEDPKRVYRTASGYQVTPLPGIYVNREHCVQVKQDPDIQYLLKKGYVKMNRTGQPRCRYSYISLQEKKRNGTV